MEPKRKTVLVVEDEAHDRLLMQGILAAEDLNLIMVEDGEAALASVAERLPDLAIVDLMLPGAIDGFEFTRRLKTDARTRHIPLMIVTALQDRESRLQALDLGVEEFICKPVDRAELSVRVRNLLRLKDYQDFLADHNRILEGQVAERTQALSRQKDLYNALSQTNGSIVRLGSREELFAAVCRIAVEHGRFRFAAIGLRDDSNNRVRPVAKYGNDAGTLGELSVSLNDADSSSNGVTGRVLRSGQHGVSNDVLGDPAAAPWHEAARRAGVGSMGSFPIRLGGAVTGVFNVYASEPGFFTDDLIAVLGEMAFDISFALDNFAREAERTRAAAALRESESRYRSLFENMLNGYAHCRMIFDDAGRPVDFIYLDVNASFERITGLKNVVGKPVSELIPGIREVSPELFKACDRVASTGTPETFDFDFKSQGKWLTISVYCPVRGEFVAVFNDFTERKRKEEELRAAEEQFRGLVEQAIAGIFIIQDGKYAYVNPRTAEIIGLDSVDELIGRDPLSWVVEADRSRIEEKMRGLIDGTTKSDAIEFKAVRQDGVIIQIGANGARATHEGRPAIIGMLQDVSEKKRAEEQIQRYMAQLENAFMSTVQVATNLGEMRDPYTAGHQRRVAEIAVAIGVELGFDLHRQEGLRVAGFLHDIGKIRIPAEILSKPGKLNQVEITLVQQHAQAGYDVLKNIKFPWPVAEIALQHHERMDGSGYPQGLKGEAIMLEARILAVADVVEAMSSHRPYRPGLGIDKALTEVERGRGNAYDAVAVDACLKLFREKGYAIPA